MVLPEQATDGTSHDTSSRTRALAFYLPQFHPVVENDVFWGTGHTEWTYLAQAKPRFPDHYQPRIPADLGFYDLRLPEVRQAQADLAREHGIHGFCYYHYWFKGRRLLERPFKEVLDSGKPDFPFCLCWTNHSWSWRRGDKERQGRLIAQEYSEEDDRNHIRWLLDAFEDERYIKIDGRPLFLVYRMFDLPDPSRTVAIWKEEAQERGVPEPYLCKVDSHGEFGDPAEFGCDAAVEFWPHHLETFVERLSGPEEYFSVNKIQDYPRVVKALLERPAPAWRRFPCVVPDRDTTPRADYAGESATAHIFRGSTPELYGRWLEESIRNVSSNPADEQLVFVNAWNEWSEGSYLEPDVKHGRAYLEATRRALRAQGAEVSPNGSPTSNKAQGETPAPTSTEELYRDLRDKHELLQQQFTELLSAEELSPLAQKLNRRIEELMQENRRLKRRQESPGRDGDLEKLAKWLRELDTGVSALLASRRWKLGNTVGDIGTRAMRKPAPPTTERHLKQILHEFRVWSKGRV